MSDVSSAEPAKAGDRLASVASSLGAVKVASISLEMAKVFRWKRLAPGDFLGEYCPVRRFATQNILPEAVLSRLGLKLVLTL